MENEVIVYEDKIYKNTSISIMDLPQELIYKRYRQH